MNIVQLERRPTLFYYDAVTLFYYDAVKIIKKSN